MWYSPRLSRETVRRLYFRAKREGIAMTVLTDRLVQQALDTEEGIDCRRGKNWNTRSSESGSTPSG